MAITKSSEEDKSTYYNNNSTIATESYPAVFDDELGELPGIQHLKLKPESQPSVMTNRRVPLALRPITKTELGKLTQLGVITPVEEATPG